MLFSTNLSNVEELITWKCSLPSFGRRRFKHTSCPHGFKVLHGIIVLIELCISFFPGFSNSKLESNAQKIRACKPLQAVFIYLLLTPINLAVDRSQKALDQ